MTSRQLQSPNISAREEKEVSIRSFAELQTQLSAHNIVLRKPMPPHLPPEVDGREMLIWSLKWYLWQVRQQGR